MHSAARCAAPRCIALLVAQLDALCGPYMTSAHGFYMTTACVPYMTTACGSYMTIAFTLIQYLSSSFVYGVPVYKGNWACWLTRLLRFDCPFYRDEG